MYMRTLFCKCGRETTASYPNHQAFKTVQLRGLLECGSCGSNQVEARLAAPHVNDGVLRTGGANIKPPVEDVGRRIAEVL